MSAIKTNLIEKALNLHKRIYPCRGRYSLEDCFTFEKGRVIFWFNTDDHSTHMLVAPVEAMA